MAKADLTVERLRELLDYDPETGIFRWKQRIAYRIKAVGAVAGCLSGDGRYIQIGIDTVRYGAHRLAWFHVTGEFPEDDIDHRNNIGTDNRFCNLRHVTHAQNMQNIRKAHKNSTSGLIGAHPHHSGRWCARIKIDGQKVWLGMFDTAEQAHVAYIDAKRKLHPFGTI